MIPVQPQPAGLPSGTIGGRSRRAAGAWRLSHVLAAPHRAAFAAGGLVLAVALLWWAAALLSQALGLALPWAVSARTAHALLLGLGLMPLFIAGVSFTVLPRWLGVAPVATRALVLPLLGVVSGWVVVLLGVHLSAALAAAGLGLSALGSALLAGRLAVLVIESRVADKDHARLLLLGWGVTVLAHWLAAVAVALGADTVALAAVQASLWGGVGLMLVVLCHRALPQFAGATLPAMGAWRSRPVLVLLALLLALQAPFAVAQLAHGGALAGGAAVLRVGLDMASGLLLFWLSLRWGLRHSLAGSAAAVDEQGQPTTLARGSLRLLAMLHLGFFWLAVAFTLDAVSHALMAQTQGQLSLGLAPLHAFTLGFLGNSLLALATRVTLQHAHQPLHADVWTWMLCGVLQAGVLFQVLAALFPVAATGLGLLSMQFCTVAGLTWVLRQLRAWGRLPRAQWQD